MKKISLKIVCLLFILFHVDSLTASHVVGGEITYRHLGAKKFELTAKVYRDCRGIPLNSLTFRVFEEVNNIAITPSYTRVKIEDISVNYSGNGNGPCYPQNSIANAGIELHTFLDTIDFDIRPYNTLLKKNSCKIYFSVEQCCRNTGITTMTTGNFYVESMLDICNSKFKNTSPLFNDFRNFNIFCNKKFSHNIAGSEFIDYDSLAFNLVAAKNSHLNTETYSGNFKPTLPMTPYCAPYPGLLNCKAIPSANPPRGFYFDVTNGNIVFTPTNCNEFGNICMEIKEFRRDSANKKWLMVGFVSRDIQLIVFQNSGNNITPEIKSLNSKYIFRTQEKQCITIESLDGLAVDYDTLNKGDTTSLKIFNMPKGATFKYLDSSAKIKIGEFCWKPHDSLLMKVNKGTIIPITVQVKDNFSPYPEMVDATFNILILPPDSFGTIQIKTFDDKNKDGIKNYGEKYRPIGLKLIEKFGLKYLKSNDSGKLNINLYKGNVTVGILSHPYYTATTSDTFFNIKKDSIYLIEFGFYKNAATYGKIYKDINNNCAFDIGEPIFKGIKVYTDSNKYVGISNDEGEYSLQLPSGNYNVHSDFKPFEYSVKCPSNNSISLVVNSSDSIYNGNDFGISINPAFTDIATYVYMKRARRGADARIVIFLKNNGFKTRKKINLYIKMSKNADFSGPNIFTALSSNSNSIKIDSIKAQEELDFTLTYKVNIDSFKARDNIYCMLTTDTINKAIDTIKDNNESIDKVIVEAPFDPNDKAIQNDTFKTLQNKTINYTIRFQNTGTDTAIRVVVIDTLNTRYLDLSKFELNWSDYPCNPTIVGNTIHFIFDDINLPFLSKSGDKSMGAFNFTLGLKSNFTTEQTFSNKAAIYFDFEKPIFTAPAIGTIVSPTEIGKLEKSTNCINQQNKLHFISKIKLENNNITYLEMSDANGNFVNTQVLSFKNTNAKTDSLNFILPKNTNSTKYKLRLRTTSPATISIANSGIIEINAIKAANFSITTNLQNNEICNQDSFKIYFNNLSNQYQVFKNNLPQNTLNIYANYTTKINANEVFKIILKDGVNNCFDTMQIIPMVNSLPTASFSLNPQIICSYDSVLMHIDSNFNADVFKNKAILYSKTTLKNIWLKNLNNAEQLSIKTYANNGCTALSNVQTIIVNSAPQKPIIANSNNNLSVLGNGTFEWYTNNVLKYKGDTFKNALTGIYRVKATNGSQCFTWSDNYIHQNTVVFSQHISPYKIFPNPANRVLTIQNIENIEIRILSMDGKEILKEYSKEKSIYINVQFIPTGLYLLKLKAINGHEYSELISIVH